MALIEYDEFAYFHENAAEVGLAFAGPPVVERVSAEVRPAYRISGLRWGTGDPELVLLHGGSQNAHTWDTTAMALDQPLLAIDLPGHGHSDGGDHGDVALADVADEVAIAIRQLAPNARGVIGMSFGGLTTLALSARAPDLVRAVVLVDILPSMVSEKAKMITDFVNGPPSFGSFDEILARTIRYNPTRSESSLRRGILHNAAQQPDGSWIWRHSRQRVASEQASRPQSSERFAWLWDVIAGLTVPLMLVRGLEEQSVLAEEHESELLTRLPGARVERVAGAGHSVQGDQPMVLAGLIADFLTRTVHT